MVHPRPGVGGLGRILTRGAKGETKETIPDISTDYSAHPQTICGLDLWGVLSDDTTVSVHSLENDLIRSAHLSPLLRRQRCERFQSDHYPTAVL